MLPYFPERVDNETVKIGQDAVLKCSVENLNNYNLFNKNELGNNLHLGIYPSNANNF